MLETFLHSNIHSMHNKSKIKILEMAVVKTKRIKLEVCQATLALAINGLHSMYQTDWACQLTSTLEEFCSATL